jgi:HEAT repeat protein
MNHKKTILQLMSLIFLTWLLVACSTSQQISTPKKEPSFTAEFTPTDTLSPKPSPTASLTPTATPTIPPTPTIVPVVEPSWRGVVLKSICLQVEQTYPQLEESYSQPIEDTVRDILLGMGILVKSSEGECEADLSITLRGEVIEATYTVAVGENVGEKIQCYSGASMQGELRLTSSEYGTVLKEILRVYSPNFVSHCAEEPTSNVEFSRVWPFPIVYHLNQIWGPQVPLQAIRIGNLHVREAAAEVLSSTELGADKENAIPILVESLKDGSAIIREYVAITLGGIGPDAIEAVPVLIEILEGASPETSQPEIFQVTSALGNITGLSFHDASYYQAWWEIHSLLVTEDADQAIPALIEILKGGSSEEQRFAAEALGRLGEEALDAIPALIEALDDHNVELREAAAEALGRMGPAAKATVPMLIQLLVDKEGWVKQKAQEALVNIGPGAIPALIKKAEENKDNYGKYTNHSFDALRTLTEIIGDEFTAENWGTPEWTETVEKIIARCWDYYNQQGSP